MADTLTPEQRSRCMSRIRGKNTTPEMRVRRLIWSLGYRYRLHRKGLPGSPDLVFVSLHKVIFVHGCFWHRHRCARFCPPKSRVAYWKNRLDRNATRDRRNLRQLRRQGWSVLTIWECQTHDVKKLTRRLEQFLSEPTSPIACQAPGEAIGRSSQR